MIENNPYLCTVFFMVLDY